MADEYRRDPVVTERRGGNSGLIIALLVIAGLVVAAFATGLIKMGGGETPAISVDAGKLPDVETGKVVMGTTETTVDVPKLEVETEKTEVDVPVIGVEKADEPSN